MALAWGLGLFAFAVGIHLAAWRLFRPSRQYLTLLALFAAVLVITSAVVLSDFGDGPARGWLLAATPTDYITFAALYTALALAYVSTFSAVQADSPSLLILLMIDNAGERGVTRDELQGHLGDEVVVLPRVEDLVTGRLVVRQGPRYVIEPRGVALAAVHMRYRSLLKMEKGG